jgi:hypothetical protein
MCIPFSVVAEAPDPKYNRPSSPSSRYSVPSLHIFLYHSFVRGIVDCRGCYSIKSLVSSPVVQLAVLLLISQLAILGSPLRKRTIAESTTDRLLFSSSATRLCLSPSTSSYYFCAAGLHKVLIENFPEFNFLTPRLCLLSSWTNLTSSP